MGLAFTNDLHDAFGCWPLAYIPYGGADFGEVLAVGRAVGDGDDSAFHNAWIAAADRLAAEAEAAERRGHRQSATALFLRASAFYATSYHPLYGAPVDPRLLSAFRKQMAALDRGLGLDNPSIQPMSIPFAGTTMPARFIPAVGQAREVRPLLILNNGYDATMTDVYFASAVAASRRGYHCLIFDGPGQGAMLYEKAVYLRPDWETVITAVVDFALALPVVDPARIVLSGWSLGGHLAPRAASGEHRLAACIADPGLWDLAGPFRDFAVKLGGTLAAGQQLSELEQPVLDRLEQVIKGNADLRWKVIQRGFWVHGEADLRGYLRSAEQFTMQGRAEAIACPMLLTQAENDPLAAGVQGFFDALRCPKTLLHFSAAEGAGGHCEMTNRSLLNQRALDWLDATLSGT